MPASKKTKKFGPPIAEITDALKPYLDQHPRAKADSYAHNPYSIRIRVIDPDFKGVGRGERHDFIWNYLDKGLTDEIIQLVSTLILLTPGEAKTSAANMDFEDPMPLDL